MRRPVTALALLVVAVTATAESAWTAGSTVSSSTAVHRATTVTGASAVRIRHTVVGGSITTVTARLRGTRLLTTTVRARFGSDANVLCTAGLFTIINSLTGLREANYTCTGFTENASRPRPLTITAS